MFRTYFKIDNLLNSSENISLPTTLKEEERQIDKRRDGRISYSNPKIGRGQNPKSLQLMAKVLDMLTGKNNYFDLNSINNII